MLIFNQTESIRKVPKTDFYKNISSQKISFFLLTLTFLIGAFSSSMVYIFLLPRYKKEENWIDEGFNEI